MLRRRGGKERGGNGRQKKRDSEKKEDYDSTMNAIPEKELLKEEMLKKSTSPLFLKHCMGKRGLEMHLKFLKGLTVNKKAFLTEQEVKNPTLQTVYDLELKRGRYGLRRQLLQMCEWCANGVRNSHTPLAVRMVCETRTPPQASSDLCMPYWIRDQEGRLVWIENPQDTELDICVNINGPSTRGSEFSTRSRGGRSFNRLDETQAIPFTLKDKAKIWLNSLRPRSIRNWVDLQAE
ncbi:hypothetical protein CK203_045782 [Vitis vinifera]|uniref:Uncharacterized protein n=1 Tax=Vitis vinifera TaxID=29760 RepID=A0A438I1A3_VITVI|nr:hypothetical protein CK203_045782 [Vitis vinifera]